MFWSGFGWVWLSFVRFDTFLGLLEHVWSGFGWVWLSMVWLAWVKFCQVFDTFLGLLERVLFWVWLGLVRLWLSFGRFDTFLGFQNKFWSGFGWVWLGLDGFCWFCQVSYLARTFRTCSCLGLVQFCKVFDIFLELLEHVLVWVWLGLVRLG